MKRLAPIPAYLHVVAKSHDAAGVKIVVDHFGHPQKGQGAACAGQQAIMRAVAKGRTWVKLSAARRR